MSNLAEALPSVQAVADEVAADLVRVSHWGSFSYINLPLMMPSGSASTVRISRVDSGWRVDDGGFAYRELEAIGAERKFPRAAAKFAAYEELETDRRLIFVTVPQNQLARAISDVATASYAVAEEVYRRSADENAAEVEDYLRERLEVIFRGARIEPDEEIKGASAHPWTVSAAVHMDSGLVVFQAVGNHAYSVYKASTAFRDLGELPNPPICVSVVKDKAAMGLNLNVLAQAGRIIQSDQPDEAYVYAASVA